MSQCALDMTAVCVYTVQYSEYTVFQNP